MLLLNTNVTDFCNKCHAIDSNKQASKNRKIKSIYKIGLNYTVCKFFKKQNMFTIWYSILT